MTAPITSTPPSGPAAPSTNSPLTSSIAGGAMGKDEFIKLLVAQMTHQDPLNPVDGQQMASELAQFSSVEQLMNIGDKLDTQAAGNNALIGAVNNSSAMGLLGKTVMVETDGIQIDASGIPPAASVDVPAGGGQLTLRITDNSGKTLHTVPLGFREAGTSAVDLAGATAGLAPGSYHIAVDCANGDGTTTPLATRVAVHVDGVRFAQDQAYITSGTSTYPISLIVSIAAPPQSTATPS